MAHAICNTMSCGCWNSDAQKICGIAETDLENGTFVVLGDMALNDDVPGGFEYNVEVASDADSAVWVVRTPEVGDTIEMQMSNDPRNFYNKAGKGLSLCYMNPNYDHIEVDALAFVAEELPDVDAYCGIAGGKLVVLDSGDEETAPVVFKVVALHQISIGAETVPTVILRCENN